MLKKIDHIGIAVENLDDIIRTLQDGFGLLPNFKENIPDQLVRVAGYTLGESVVEYLEPTSPDSGVARFINDGKNRLHHIAFRVDNLSETLKSLKEKGFQLIDEKPKDGASGKKVAFLHPKSFNGILIELCEYPFDDKE